MQSPKLQNSEVSFNYHNLKLALIELMTIKIKPTSLSENQWCPDSNDLESDHISIVKLTTSIMECGTEFK